MVWYEGSPKLISSKPGYAVTRADKPTHGYSHVKCCDTLEEATKIQEEMKKDTKYPNYITIWPCFLKEYDDNSKVWDFNSDK